MRSALFCLLALFSAFAQPADLVLRNGKIVTLNTAQPEARALAVRDGRISAVGPDAESARWIGPKTRVVDLHGMLVTPGFIEGHGHFSGTGEYRLSLDLRNARSWEEIVAQVKRAADGAKPGDWIVGRGWHQSKWDRVPQPNVEGFPVRTALDAVSPHNPVLLVHASGHATFVNAQALDSAGIGKDTPNPPGGEILKDAKGLPTGLLRERASGLASAARERWQSRRTAAERDAETRRIIELATDDCISKGITTFEDAGSPLNLAGVYRQMADRGELRLRLWVMLRAPNEELEANLDRFRVIGAGDNHLTIRAIKRQIDGALGSRGAWMLEPYSDQPDSRGLATEEPADIARTAQLALQHGYQLCVHAIGDRANREVLDIYERTFSQHPEGKSLRWRIEHAQHLSARDIPRFSQLGVIAAMQGIHCTSDAPYVLLRLGASRAEEGAYVWRKLMDTGAVVGNGTDAPVEDVDPIASFYASVTRRLADGSTFYPAQKMTRLEALKSYTWNNAYAAFEEKDKGSLEVGKLADFTVLTRDIMTIPDNEIPGAKVAFTIVGGRVVYERK